MACSTATLATAPPCLKYTSPTQQLKDLDFLLAAAVNKIDGTFTINWATILASAKEVAVCVPPGRARAKAANIVEAGLTIASTTALDCFSEGDLEQVRLYLTCVLIGKINP